MLTKGLGDVFEQIRNEQTFKVELTNITWKIPHVTPSDFENIKCYDIIKSGVNLPIAFRSWDSYVNPKLRYGSQHSWNVKLSANREKPRFAIIGFTLNGELITNNLSNMKAYLTSYPHDNLNIYLSKNQYAHLYEMYSRFPSIYYNRESQPFLTTNEFKLKAPIFVVESVKTGPIDVRILIELKTPSHENTQVYCLLIHDRLVE